MTTTLKRYLPDGSTRAVWDDDQSDRERRHGVAPVRASRVEAAASGRFHVDFTPLAEATGRPEFRCCLPRTYARHDAAVAAEVAWLEANFVMEGTDGAHRD